MDEQQCVARALAGDLDAFEQLVAVYQRPVYSLAYRMLGDAGDAEDAAQETFLRAYSGLGAYEPRRRFASWLLSITAHWCIDRLRRRKGIALEYLDDIAPLGGLDERTEAAAIVREDERETQRWLGMLPAQYRLMIVLRYWHDLSYAEIADLTGLSLSTVRMRLCRARRLLAACYGAATGSVAPSMRPAASTRASMRWGDEDAAPRDPAPRTDWVTPRLQSPALLWD
jgi:RNA polymerase sigma-70 factor (ECF subfamily)